MTATVLYEGELRTVCTHLKSQSQVETDAPTDNQGKGERFSPTDLVATSLAACMVSIMGIKSRAMGFDLQGIRVDVEKIMYADPRRIGEINLTFHIPENLASLDIKSQIIFRNAAETCPVFKSIHPDIKVRVDWGAWS